MKLIDKTAVEAKIKSIEYETNYEPFTDEVLGKRKVCKDIKDLLDTLEVKEVDLDFMLHEYWNLSPKITTDCLESATMTKDEMINFAKHFYELGLKAKGE